jgi:hypothetical protein
VKRSGDRAIGRSGDLKSELTAETRSRGENQKPTTEARRHGEGSRDRGAASDRVIGKDAYVCHPERVGAHATPSRRIATIPVPEHAASGSSHETANLTAETRSRGENQKPTTETRRHGEKQKPSTEARRHGESEGENKCPEPECIHPAEQVSGHDFSRAEKDKKNWALAPAVFRITMHTISATLREIFDESAYDRFLLRTNAARSIASYREFSRERDVAMLKKPRCC